MIHRSLSPRNYLRNISGFCTFVQTTLEDLNDFFWYDVLYKTQRTLLRDLTETNGFSEVMNWKGGSIELFKLVFSLISVSVKASYSTLHARMDEKITWTSSSLSWCVLISHVRLIVQQKLQKTYCSKITHSGNSDRKKRNVITCPSVFGIVILDLVFSVSNLSKVKTKSRALFRLWTGKSFTAV